MQALPSTTFVRGSFEVASLLANRRLGKHSVTENIHKPPTNTYKARSHEPLSDRWRTYHEIYICIIFAYLYPSTFSLVYKHRVHSTRIYISIVKITKITYKSKPASLITSIQRLNLKILVKAPEN